MIGIVPELGTIIKHWAEHEEAPALRVAMQALLLQSFLLSAPAVWGSLPRPRDTTQRVILIQRWDRMVHCPQNRERLSSIYFGCSNMAHECSGFGDHLVRPDFPWRRE